MVGLGLQQRVRCWLLQHLQQLHLSIWTSSQVSARWSLYHGSQAKATARVDVPETPMVKRRGQGVELAKMNFKGKEEQSSPVFLLALSRVVITSCLCTGGMLIADLHEQVAIMCHMPCDKIMLVHRSKMCARAWLFGRMGYRA